MPNKPRKLFSVENIVGATGLSFFTWVVLSIASLNTAVAVVNSEQLVDKETRKVVLAMHESLIRIDENVKIIKERAL